MRLFRCLVGVITAASALVLLVSSMHPPRALACSFRVCEAPAVHPASGEIPANEFSLLYNRGRTFADGGVLQPHLYKADGDGGVEIPLELEPTGAEVVFALRPQAALSAGDQVVLEAAAHPDCSPTQALRTHFVLTEPRARPTTLGTLAVAVSRRPLQVPVGIGSCFDDVDASLADLTLTFAPEARAFAKAVRLSLQLDGRAHPRFADDLVTVQPEVEPSRAPRALEPGHERVFTVCGMRNERTNPYGGISPGVHRASMRATFADGSHLDTPEVEFELRCDGADAGVPDAAAAVTTTTSEVLATPHPVPAPARSAEDGCSLAGASGRRSPLGGLALLGVCGLLVARRRRERAAVR